jgi:hypothetical protein
MSRAVFSLMQRARVLVVTTVSTRMGTITLCSL